MKIQPYFVLILFLILCFGFSTLNPANGQEKKPPPKKNYVAHEILVRFHPWADESEKQAVRDALEAVKVKTIKSIRVEYWRLPEEITTGEALDFLKKTPSVESAEPNYLYTPQTIPNDPRFNQLWYLENNGQTVNGTTGIPGADIHAAQAWDIETGSHDIVIAVIDSGVAFDHPDLQNNVWVNQDEIPDNGIDDDHNGYVDDRHGWDFNNDDSNPSDYSKDLDCNGHGTHVAGIIAAQGNNGVGTAGVMWHASIMPLQIFDLFQTSSFAGIIQQINILSAMAYAVDNGAKIINCSFGGGPCSQYIYDAMNYANQHGVLAVISAGNGGSDLLGDDNDRIPTTYPASCPLPNIISVAATNESDELSSYSNYGLQSVDVAAPGGSRMRANIYSTIPPERVTLFYDDFESGDSQWVTNGIYEPWSIGYNSAFGSTVSSDSVLWYHNNESSHLRMRYPVDARNCRGLMLAFEIAYELEDGYDYCFMEASWDGFNWVDVLSATGSSYGIIPYYEWYSELDLGQFYLGVRLESDYSYNDDGVQIDNIKITGIPWVFKGNEYGYKSGTSMAAPVVSGLAGLIWSLSPDISYLEVKNIILNTVDRLPSLDGKVLTGGRVNAYKALQIVEGGGPFWPPTADFAATPTSGILPFPCNFTDLSTDIPSSWIWGFGDGSSSTEKNPQHVYANDGWYSVSLTVSNMYGSDTETKLQYIYAAPCTNQAVKIGPLYFDSLQGAYDQCLGGETIQAQALVFSEQLTFDYDVNVTLFGGFDCGYTSHPMATILDGKLIIDKGTVTIDGLIIQ